MERGISDGIAIVGMAGRFPGAPDVGTFWSNLCDGVESVGPISNEALLAAEAETGDPAFVDAAAAMDGIEEFDPAFFGMSSREAELTDPQHRVLLETVWAALEDAGCDPARFDGRIGLFGGVAANQYLRRNILSRPDLMARVGFYPLLLASEREYAITRAAFKFGLAGPAVTVITACSTSAVATHLASQSLLAGDSDLALAGGAHINLEGRYGYVYEEDSILSPDGHVRAFDAGARGTVMASGVAFIVLKRLEDALADRDTIYALVRGSAVNNDGAARISFTAPSTEGQTAVIEDALAVAEVDPATIGLLESHGTGTSLGDPIEVEALTRAYRRHTNRRGYCAIGSLKSNIGHLDAAAGAASIIKAALALHHERIPPAINFASPNPRIDFEASPFFVNTEMLDWSRSETPRRAGVSSFGFGGTNAHVILEEAPLPPGPPREQAERPWILVLSAKSPEALAQRRQQLADHLEAHPGVDLADAAHTLSAGRSAMVRRTAVVASDLAGAIEALRDPASGQGTSGHEAIAGSEVAFLFTGQGAQYAGMGVGLYRAEPVFADVMRACAEIVGAIDGRDLVGHLYGDGADAPSARERILQTDIGQPLILALQYSLARLWASWGITPSAMVGHSVGEIAAACVGGALRLEDGLRLAAARGRLMQGLPAGAMTAVLADEAAVAPFLDTETSLAAVNAEEQCVVSGRPEAIEALEGRLAEAGLSFRRLPTDRAFHSAMMDPVLEPLRSEAEGMHGSKLGLAMVSTVTGAWVDRSELAEAGYWVRHARDTVRFADAVGRLVRERPGIILLEIGPGSTLTSLAHQHPDLPPGTVAVSTLPHKGADEDRLHAYRALAEAWVAGADVDWSTVNGDQGKRIPLPTYPFARERHWIERPARAAAEISAGGSGFAPSPPRPTAPAATPERTTSAAPLDPRQSVLSGITSILADLGGLDAAAIDSTGSFTDLGFDSLTLTQLNSRLRKQYGVRVTLGQLLGETPSVDALVDRIVSELPRDALAALEVSAVDSGADPGSSAGEGQTVWTTSPAPHADAGKPPAEEIEALIMEQLRVMDQQLDLMRTRTVGNGGPPAGVGTVPPRSEPRP